MSRPIKETLILQGKDAERFMRAIKSPRPISQEEKDRMKVNYEKLKVLACSR